MPGKGDVLSCPKQRGAVAGPFFITKMGVALTKLAFVGEVRNIL